MWTAFKWFFYGVMAGLSMIVIVLLILRWLA